LIILSAFVTTVDLVPTLVRSNPHISFTSLVEWARKARSLVIRKSRSLDVAGESEYLPFTQAIDKDDFESSPTRISMDRADSPEDEVDMLGNVSKPSRNYVPPPMTNSMFRNQAKAYHNTRHVARHSLGSDHSTLRDEPPTPSTPEPHITWYQRLLSVVRILLMVLERGLIPYAWGQMLSGLSVYFGMGKTHYITGLMAHFISKHTNYSNG